MKQEIAKRRILKNFKGYLEWRGISWNYIALIILSVLGIIFLSYNIYNTVKRAELNYNIKQQEEEERDRLLEEGLLLDKQVEYLDSADAKRNLAAEGYKLAEPGETLYKIDRVNETIEYIENENMDPINLDDNHFWWKLVLFGER